jgi:hypothetical protein
MTHAFGNLAALAPGSSVRALALCLCERYNHATGSNDGMIVSLFNLSVSLSINSF